MKNRTLLLVFLAIGFVGATSCGNDNSQNQSLAAENAALRAALAQRAAQPAQNVNVTMTQVATSVANVTVTQVGSSTTTSNGTTVVYTITSNSTGTAIRQ